MKDSLPLLILFCAASSLCLGQKKTTAKVKPTIAHADSLFAAGRYQDAIPAYEGVLKDAAAAKDARAWYRLGASWFNTNNHEKALPAFEHAYGINPGQQGVRLALARTYSLLNRTDNGIVMLDSTIASGNGNVVLFDSDPSFENLRKDPRYTALRERALDISYPCRKLPESRKFDFWLGEWDVYPTANPTLKAGFNKITKAAQGCVIVENWQAISSPHEGMSLNYFDPNDRKWKQKWAGSGQDVQDFYDGEYVDGAMRFKFIGKNADGTDFTGRLTFTNIEDGRVRQHSERTDDGGKTWQTIYDLTYIRRAEGGKP
jgi:tetratricopeptide (TPR) repeat protein